MVHMDSNAQDAWEAVEGMHVPVCIALLGRLGIPQPSLHKRGASQQSSELMGVTEQQGSEPP